MNTIEVCVIIFVLVFTADRIYQAFCVERMHRAKMKFTQERINMDEKQFKESMQEAKKSTNAVSTVANTLQKATRSVQL